MASRLFLRLSQSVTNLIERPLFNFGSFLIVLASILSLALPAIQNLDLERQELLSRADQVLLELILLESLLRLVSSRRSFYIRSFAFSIDLLSILPLSFIAARALSVHFPFLQALSSPLEWPGILLVRGIRSLRLLPVLFYFHRSRMIVSSRQGSISPIKERIFSGIAGLTFGIILISGISIAFYNHKNIQEKRELRRQQILLQAQSYGILQARLVFEKNILGSWITQNGQHKWIAGTEKTPERIRRFYKTGRDYIQIDEVLPGQSFSISFLDLVQSQRRLELTALFVGILIIFALIGILNFYLERLILEPVEKARRAIHLRLYEEEIETTDIAREPYTEIVRLINDIDRLYQRMRAPAKKLLSEPRGTTRGGNGAQPHSIAPSCNT
jgi:hypothetical protein